LQKLNTVKERHKGHFCSCRISVSILMLLLIVLKRITFSSPFS